MNIVPLTDLSSDREFEAHFRSLPRVVLEGRSDVTFFAVWFEHLLSDLDFVAAEAICGTGGCTAVGKAVRQSVDEEEIPAIGIVDRDWLHREHAWELLYSLEETALKGLPDEDIVTASLWEIEAYLLRPELIGRWIGLQRNPPPASVAEKGGALAKIIEECEALLYAMPLLASAHVSGEERHVKYLSDVAHHGLAAKCAVLREPVSGDPRVVLETVEGLIDRIRAHAPATPEDRLPFLLRYLDTKRLLERIGKRLGLYPDAHHALSELMSIVGARPAELEAIVTAAAERFALA